MAAAKKDIYILEEINWAETKLLEWKEYVDGNPIARLRDRIHMKQTKTGSMPMIVASIEQQIKCLRDTMKEYIVLLETVNKMRKAEEFKKKEMRGGSDLPEAMEDER